MNDCTEHRFSKSLEFTNFSTTVDRYYPIGIDMRVIPEKLFIASIFDTGSKKSGERVNFSGARARARKSAFNKQRQLARPVARNRVRSNERSRASEYPMHRREREREIEKKMGRLEATTRPFVAERKQKRVTDDRRKKSETVDFRRNDTIIVRW